MWKKNIIVDLFGKYILPLNIRSKSVTFGNLLPALQLASLILENSNSSESFNIFSGSSADVKSKK